MSEISSFAVEPLFLPFFRTIFKKLTYTEEGKERAWACIVINYKVGKGVIKWQLSRYLLSSITKSSIFISLTISEKLLIFIMKWKQLERKIISLYHLTTYPTISSEVLYRYSTNLTVDMSSWRETREKTW